MFDLEKRRATVSEALAKAEKAEADGDLALAFSDLATAWSQTSELTFEDQSAAAEVRKRLLRDYPRLAEKPIPPEAARKYQVEAKSYIKSQSAPGGDGFRNALASYQKLLDMAPWYPDAYYNAALVRAQLHDYAGAAQDMNVYLQLEPDAPDARVAQDKIYEWETKSKTRSSKARLHSATEGDDQ